MLMATERSNKGVDCERRVCLSVPLVADRAESLVMESERRTSSVDRLGDGLGESRRNRDRQARGIRVGV